MELIAELEREKRGVYAGAVGYFGYGSVDGDKEIEGAMDVSFVLPRREMIDFRVLTSLRRHASRCEQCLSKMASLIFKLG